MVLQPEVVLVPPSPVLVPPLADDEAEWVVGGAHQGVLMLRAAAAARRPGQAEVAVVGSGVRQLLPVDVRHRGGCRRLSIMLQVRERERWSIRGICPSRLVVILISTHLCPEVVMPHETSLLII